MTLVILAAGMGSRYGGLKQIDPIAENGEFIIDFSIYDAVLSGFDKVVFVIKRENLDEFVATVGKRFEDKVKVEYAFQELSDLPCGYKLPEERTKPLGTAHALWAARTVVNEPFAVINADDFYGRSSYELLAKHLSAASASDKPVYCMVGYPLQNTLTDNGTVSRGICEVNENAELIGINERTAIRKDIGKAVYTENGEDFDLSLDAIASMNCWGFTPDIFDKLGEGFKEFLDTPHDNPLKCEYFLPMAVGDFMHRGECTVKVYNSTDSWYGVTYHEDKERVKSSIKAMQDNGTYPRKLS